MIQEVLKHLDPFRGDGSPLPMAKRPAVLEEQPRLADFIIVGDGRAFNVKATDGHTWAEVQVISTTEEFGHWMKFFGWGCGERLKFKNLPDVNTYPAVACEMEAFTIDHFYEGWEPATDAFTDVSKLAKASTAIDRIVREVDSEAEAKTSIETLKNRSYTMMRLHGSHASRTATVNWEFVIMGMLSK